MPGKGRQLTARLPAGHRTRPAGRGGVGFGTGQAVAGAGVSGQSAQGPGNARNELGLAREIRAREIVAGHDPPAIAAIIRRECMPSYGTTWIRAYRLALGIALADVVAQVRAWYVAEGRQAPRFSETLLSAYESGQKRPGPEYLHYLCAVYRADPPQLGYQGRCFCGRAHGGEAASATDSPEADSATADSATADSATADSATADSATADSATSDKAGAFRVSVTAVAAGPASPGDRAGARAPVAPAGEGLPVAKGLAAVPMAAAGRALPATVPAAPESPATAARSGSRSTGGVSTGGRDAGGESADGREAGAVSADGRDAGDVLRGMLLRLLTDAAAAPDSRFFGAADHLRRQLDDALLGRTVSVTMLDHWEETTAGHGAKYMSVPPLRLLCDVLLDFGDIRRMCAERQPIECAERLCRLAGQLAGLTGMAMINLGDQRLARSFFRTARTAADETGDRRLRAWVAAREALVPLYYGDPRDAAALARAGTDLAGRKPCVAGVMAPVIEARALARLAGRGRREALDRVRGTLDRAHDTLGELPAADSAGTAFGYTERQLFFHEGDALVTLGDYQGATRAFAHALRLYSPAEFLDRALVMLGEARCLAEADEPEQALRLGRDTLVSLPGQHRTEIVVHAARGLGELVAARHGRLPALNDYQEALRAARAPEQPRPA